MTSMHIPSNWQPTSANINALPEPLRRYIHDLETLCDPSGIVAQNALLRDQNRQLEKQVLELEKELEMEGACSSL